MPLRCVADNAKPPDILSIRYQLLLANNLGNRSVAPTSSVAVRYQSIVKTRADRGL